jgi:DNA segregation ATPase FtsK/SpoIIIE-like protein
MFHLVFQACKMEQNQDELLEEAIKFAKENGKIRSTLLQIKFKLGYNRANKIMKQMEDLKILDKENKGVFYLDRIVIS